MILSQTHSLHWLCANARVKFHSESKSLIRLFEGLYKQPQHLARLPMSVTRYLTAFHRKGAPQLKFQLFFGGEDNNSLWTMR